jgi:hypothetical protein
LECSDNAQVFKLYGTNHILVYADDDILVTSVRTTKPNKEYLAVASMEAGLEADAVKTKYMYMVM